MISISQKLSRLLPSGRPETSGSSQAVSVMPFPSLHRPSNHVKPLRMEFEWMEPHALIGDVSEKEVEESFEDPFSIRLLPDIDSSNETRYFILGKSISGAPLFTVFWTDGKRYRVIVSRTMTDSEAGFYERKNSDPAN